jgi:hypothetical protein
MPVGPWVRSGFRSLVCLCPFRGACGGHGVVSPVSLRPLGWCMCGGVSGWLRGSSGRWLDRFDPPFVVVCPGVVGSGSPVCFASWVGARSVQGWLGEAAVVVGRVPAV